MKSLPFLFLFLFTSSIALGAIDDWGRTGHRVVGEIAQRHLTKKAAREIKDLLHGQSLAFVSTFADEIRSDDAYRQYAPWHYVNFPFDSTYEAHPKSEKGDIYTAIHKCLEVLKDDTAQKDKKAFHLKLLVHFLGDLHQPLHVGMADDRGGNKFQVQWFDEGTNLHNVWDERIIESYQMSYLELADNSPMLSQRQIAAIQDGSVNDWMYESRALCEKVYSTTKSGENLGYLYMYDYVNVVRTQLQKGGLRLAKLLNEVFS